MCNKDTNLGYVHFIKQSIIADERTVTNFGRANDNLSRCVSEMLHVHERWTEGMMYDHSFDGGEFSGRACAEAMHHDYNAIAQKYGWNTVDEVHTALSKVCSARYIYFNLGFFI